MSDSPRLPYTVSNKRHNYVDQCYIANKKPHNYVDYCNIVNRKVDVKHVSRHLNKPNPFYMYSL